MTERFAHPAGREGCNQPGLPGASRAPGAMQIDLVAVGALWRVIVDHEVNAADVQAAGSNVRGNLQAKWGTLPSRGKWGHQDVEVAFVERLGQGLSLKCQPLGAKNKANDWRKRGGWTSNSPSAEPYHIVCSDDLGLRGGLASGGPKGMVWLDVVGPEAGEKNAAG